MASKGIPLGYYGNLAPYHATALSNLVEKLDEQLPQTNLTEMELCIWGVPLADVRTRLTKPKQVVLLKFLRAREWNAVAACDMLIKCLKWRADFDIGALEREEFSEEMEAMGDCWGRDGKGHPVTYNRYGNVDVKDIFSVPGAIGKFVRWRVRLMERAIAQLDFEAGIERVVQVHDYAGASMMRMDANVKQASKRIIQLFQDNYPEMLETKLFLNVPLVMELLYKLFSAFSAPATASKFQMVRSGKVRSTMLALVSPDQLPAAYGGFQQEDVTWGDVQQVTVAKGSSPVLSWQVPGGHSVQWEFIIASGPTLRFAASMGTPDATAAQSADVGAGGKVINGSEGEGKFSLLLDNGGNGAEAIVYYRIRTVAPY